ncbi:MAG TPA: DUF6046 domain-containing protein [Panacibacter sp.]|nr:DUF6046 domain-containing protein [Panacibacter sp.]HNP46970.1 DUF6046 domain-containing protein [Panacibacter sp.]
MVTIDINNVLGKVYGIKALPFPKAPAFDKGAAPAKAFPVAPNIPVNSKSKKGTSLYRQNALGAWVFLPAKLGSYDLPNPLIMISGEKSIVETDVVDVGTVFEKVFTKPYDITIICTLLNNNGTWPEDDIIQMAKLYKEGDLYTLSCALTDIFLQPKDNFLLTRIDLPDMQGVEDAQVIQLQGRSNIDFILELK